MAGPSWPAEPTTQTAPSGEFEAITNDAPFTEESRGIYIGVAGNVDAVKRNGQNVVFVGAAAGSILPIRAIRVRATTTTATSLVALF